MTETPTAPETEVAIVPAPVPLGLAGQDDRLLTEKQAKSDEEVFQAVLAKHRGEAAPKPAAPPPAEESPTEEPQRKQADSEGKPESTPKEPSEPDPAVASAKQFLKLKTKVPQRMLDTISDAEALEWAEERRGRESTVDAAFARAKRAETSTPDKGGSSQATEPVEPARPTTDKDLRAVTDAFAEELALTDDGRARLDEMLDRVISPLRDQIASIQETSKVTETREKMSVLDLARQQAGKRFPDLATDDGFEKIFADAKALENSPTYAESGRSPADYLPDLFERVARSLGMREVDSDAEAAARVAAESEADRQQRNNADPGPITSTPTVPREKTKQEQDYEVFKRVSVKHGRTDVGARL